MALENDKWIDLFQLDEGGFSDRNLRRENLVEELRLRTATEVEELRGQISAEALKMRFSRRSWKRKE